MSEAQGPHLAIPLSPPSPPADGVKEGSKSHFPNYTPASPQSPYMSVATKSYGPTFTQTHTSSVPRVDQRSPSPPSSAPMSTQVSQLPISMTATTSFPTPDNSVIGQTRKVPEEFDEEHVNKRQRNSNLVNPVQEIKSNFEKPLPASPCQSTSTMTPSIRMRLEDGGHHATAQFESFGQTAGTMQPASFDMSLEQLQKNVGEAFHLCKSALPRIRPDPGQHLLSSYGLSDLHAKVARTHPVTHEKTNKLRKSYEGQIKNFALAGRNKPTKDETPEGQWSGLNMLLLEPEDSWCVSKAMGKSIEATPDMVTRLQKAMSLQPGRVRNQEYWDDVLGHEKPRPLQAPDPAGKKAVSGAVHRPPVNGNTARSTSLAAGEAVRPRRTGKKRSYADNSFEGYGDGYVDDDAADVDQNIASNSEDGGHGAGRKKRKKEHALNSPTPVYAGPSSYGVGGWNSGDR